MGLATDRRRSGRSGLRRHHRGPHRKPCHPSIDGQRPTQLADQLQITKQSVNELLGHLERVGHITRQRDPADRRASVVRITAKGQRLEQTRRDNAQAADHQIAGLLGTHRYTQLCDTLAQLTGHISTHDPTLT